MKALAGVKMSFELQKILRKVSPEKYKKKTGI